MNKIKVKILTAITSTYLIMGKAFATPTVDKILTRPTTKYTAIKNANALPDVSVENLISDVIKIILSWTFTIAVIALLVAGFYYLTAQEEEENSTKAKEIIKYLIIGLVVISAAYGIVAGIAEFDFFKTRV